MMDGDLQKPYSGFQFLPHKASSSNTWYTVKQLMTLFNISATGNIPRIFYNSSFFYHAMLCTVCPSVCLSLTRQYCVETAKHKRFSSSGSHSILFFSKPNDMYLRGRYDIPICICIPSGILLNRVVKCSKFEKKSQLSTSISFYLGNRVIFTVERH